MEQLSKEFLKGYVPQGGVAVSPPTDGMPEKVIQFGEGNFLRAFVDWMFDKLNREGLFNGRIVVVQPIENGLVPIVNEQDGLYTLLLRGIEDGKFKETREIITSVSRGLNPYTQWDGVLACAESPEMEIAVSNTTEAGIVFDETDVMEGTPKTYPGKLTAFLYHRWKHFGGDETKGMIIIPCELIEENGRNLKKAVLRFAELWRLEDGFVKWTENACTFVSTLVDRVVTGYPRDEAEKIESEIGCRDKLIDTGEYFHLWVLEGPAQLAERIPFHKAGLHVVWTDDQRPYRNRKVRILNGAHTGSVPAAFFCGLDTVKEMMDDRLTGRFVNELIDEEILKAFKNDNDTEALTSLANAVKDRFRNPYIKHYLLSIMLNSSSKFAVRDLPSLVDYYDMHGALPKRLVFSLAALLTVYRDGERSGGMLRSKRDGAPFEMRDDEKVLEFMGETWKSYTPTPEGARRTAQTFLAESAIWGRDLNDIPGLAGAVAENLLRITEKGMRAAMEEVLQ
ncbi:tagaturonate reductase [Cloacibacillus evryensis]|uniref:tagaturonate reductase n=1 Tax=Cloacibacillus evryensis TaxID=508460 RepID=UPI00241C8A6D|nr:tagaturonate reductase [Cloacibacillus evryensis]